MEVDISQSISRCGVCQAGDLSVALLCLSFLQLEVAHKVLQDKVFLNAAFPGKRQADEQKPSIKVRIRTELSQRAAGSCRPSRG